MKKVSIMATAMAFLFMTGTAATAQTVKDLPPGTVKVSGVVPGMGEHWMNPKDKKRGGPVFGVMNDKIVFIEFEYLNKSFAGPKDVKWNDYKFPANMAPIDHMDFEYLPKGHRNMEVPHVAVHLYTVPHAVHMAYRPKGRGGPPKGG